MNDPNVCPTCKKGKLLTSGVVAMPNECCAIYFFGEGSSSHQDWKDFCALTTPPSPAVRFKMMLMDKSSTRLLGTEITPTHTIVAMRTDMHTLLVLDANGTCVGQIAIDEVPRGFDARGRPLAGSYRTVLDWLRAETNEEIERRAKELDE